MEKCPFWSTNTKIEICNNECPMYKSEEGCIFKLYYSETLVQDEDIEQL